MSKAQLKKQLSVLTKEQIIEVMLELYDARKEAREYLEFYLNPDENAKLEEYKRIICDEFFPKRGDPKCRCNVCRKAISDFKKLNPDPVCMADLMLYYIEAGCEMTSLYGDMWEQYYTTLETNFGKAMELIANQGYTEQFSQRIERMLKSVENCGWGFPDALYDIYYEHKSRVSTMPAQPTNT